MLANRSPEIRRAYDQVVKEAFGAMFEGKEVSLDQWKPFVDLMIKDI